MFAPPVQFRTNPEALEIRARHDFQNAMRRGWLHRMAHRLLRHEVRLLPFELAQRCMRLGGRRDLGIHAVEIDRIIGSLGRFDEFDRWFYPHREETLWRWVSIDRAQYEGINLPPVDLYKVGEIYFVIDGNHRISVARSFGQQYIEAHIIEIDAESGAVPLNMTQTVLCPPT